MSTAKENSESNHQELSEQINRWYHFEKRELSIQRIFLAILLLLLIAGLAGLFGEGALSLQKISREKAEISYHRFLRSEAKTDIQIELANTGDSNVTISFNNDYIRRVRIDDVVPEPSSVKSEEGRLTFEFEASAEGVIIFYLLPLDVGVRTLDLDIGQERHHITQYVYF